MLHRLAGCYIVKTTGKVPPSTFQTLVLRKDEDKKDKAIGPVQKVVNEVISYRSLVLEAA